MPFRKLDVRDGSWAEARECCRHAEHEPPTMIVLEPGTYEWTCPACGAVRTVRVPPRSSLFRDRCRHSAQSWEKKREGMWCGDCQDFIDTGPR